ncbi:hypothetical protein D3C81_1894190 [compost metagenome]
MTPFEKAPTKVCGMMFIKNSMVPPCSVAAWLYLAIALPSSVSTLIFIPTPGFAMLTTTRPMTSAMVERISKYRRDLTPILPTSLMLPILAIPTTTVPKIIGANSIFMSLMKPSAKG